MKLNSEHFIVAIFLAAFTILLVGLAYKGVRDTERDMQVYREQISQQTIKLKMGTPSEILEEISK
jgi:hypothetical protein